MFKRQSKILMQEIMEEKLPCIYSQSFEYDMFEDTNYTETFDRTVNASGKNDSESSGTSSSTLENSGSSHTEGDSLTKTLNTPQNLIRKPSRWKIRVKCF